MKYLNKYPKYKILVASNLLNQPDDAKDLWIANFDRIQWVPNKLENIVTIPRPESLSGMSISKLRNEGRSYAIQTALESDCEWIMFLGITLRTKADVVLRFLGHEHPFVGGIVKGKDGFSADFCMMNEKLFGKIDLSDYDSESDDMFFKSKALKATGYNPLMDKEIVAWNVDK